MTGECSAVIGLSGSGKSNLLVFIANRKLSLDAIRFVRIDLNLLENPATASLSQLIQECVQDAFSSSAVPENAHNPTQSLKGLLGDCFKITDKICLLFDRFDLILDQPALQSYLRALRDMFKYRLTLVTACRRALDPASELAELFFAHTIYLGPLSPADSLWSIQRDAERWQVDWDQDTKEKLFRMSGGYPSLLRAVCEAVAGGANLDETTLSENPSVSRRIEELLDDNPSLLDLEKNGLTNIPLMQTALNAYREQSGPAAPKIQQISDQDLTAKEARLLSYFQTHAGEVCEKDDLVRAVWPEDKIYLDGIRDDSLAQLIRRLRKKIEKDPSDPELIQTIPGRGYLYRLFD